jgi:hypothetical protein
LSGIAEAQVTPAPVAPEPVAAEVTQGQVKFGVSGLAGLPLGDFGEVLTFAVGVLGTVDYGVNPQLELTGRLGLIYFVPDSDIDGLTFYDIPVWGGGRYFIDPSGQGVYLHGELGLNMYKSEIEQGGQSFSNSETEIGVNLLAGLKAGKLLVEGGLYVGSIDESSDSMMLGATGGTTF